MLQRTDIRLKRRMIWVATESEEIVRENHKGWTFSRLSLVSWYLFTDKPDVVLCLFVLSFSKTQKGLCFPSRLVV